MDRGLFRLLSVLVLCALIGGYVACADGIQGVIYINSAPVGADIFLKSQSSPIDGLSVDDLIDITPKQFSVAPGKYTIYLQKYGYVSWWEDITVVAGQILNLGTIELEVQAAMYGALHIETNPGDADIVLERVVPTIESRIFGKTPLSLESLPPGEYKYTITKEGYYDVLGSIEIEVGKVTEIAIPLRLIPTTEPVRFNSLPVGAEVYVFPPSKNECKDFEALDADEIKAEASKFKLGYIGYTPTTFDMIGGKWMYVMTLDSHYPACGTFSVTVGTPVPDINETLIPFPQFVEVYFETKQDNVSIQYKGDELGRTPSIDNCSIAGEVCYGVWVSLPTEMIVDVVFSKQHFKDLTVRVDTSLFKGRPSKWGQLIDLEKVRYTITSKTDQYTAILPAEPQTVIAEECGGDYHISILPTYNLDYVIKDITLNNSSFMDIPPNRTTLMVSKDACDTGPIVRDSILSVTGERKIYTIEMVVGPGGSASCDGLPCADELEVLSGDDSPAITFTPDEGYELLRVRVNGRPSYDDPLILHEVRKNFRVEAQFRPTHVTITPTGDTTHGNYTPSEPYKIEYNGCTQFHEIFPNPGFWGRLQFLPDTNKSDFEAEAVVPRIEFQTCGVTQNMTALASFFPYTFNITAVAHGNGKIEPSGNMTAEYMSSITFILTADPGNSLIKITDNGVDVTIRALDDDESLVEEGVNKGKRSRYVLSNITDDHDIQAFFTGSSDYFTVTPYWNKEGGNIVPSKPQVVKRGADVTFEVTANSCHTIGSIVIEDKEDPFSSKEEDSFSAERGPHPSPKTVTLKNVQNSKDLTVEFVPKVYTITVEQAEGGTITYDGELVDLVPVACGADATFTITANPGNAVHKLIIDGVEEPGTGAEMKYTFKDVTKDHTLSAIFILPPDPDFSADLCEAPSNRPVDFANPVPVCRAPPNHPVKFKDLTKNSPTAWLWDFGDGIISTEREPTHRYANTGTYTVRLTAFNAAAPEGVSKVQQDFIIITTDPIAKFTVEPDGGMTPPGFTVQMTDLSLNAAAADRVTFAWDFGDGKGGSIGRNPSYTYDSPGVYRIGLKVEKPYIAADYYYQTITILQEPVADFSAHPISGPAPLAVQFEDKSQGFPTQWLWDFGDGEEGQRGSYDVNPRYVYAEPGVYTVTLRVASDEGSAMKTIENFITVT